MHFKRIRFELFSKKWTIAAGVLLSCIVAGLTITLPIVLTSKNLINDRRSFDGFNATTVDKLNSKNIDYVADSSDSLLHDVTEKAKLTNDVFVYNITWAAVFHKFGAYSHMLKLLELNPNANIIFFTTNAVNNNFLLKIKSQYPNVFFLRNINNWSAIYSRDEKKLSENNWFDQYLGSIVSRLYEKYCNLHLYVDDFFILARTSISHLYLNYATSVPIEFLRKLYEFNTFLSKFKTVNMFADGTTSATFFSNEFYNIYRKCGFNVSDESYKNSEVINKRFAEGNISFDEFCNDKKLWYQSTLSSITSNQKGNKYGKSKFFLPDLTMVKEMNSSDSTYLDQNILNNDYFNPYNSLSANLINFIKTFNNNSINLLYSAFISNYNDVKPLYSMDNAINYVYSGSLMEDNTISDRNAMILLDIYNNAVNNNAGGISNIKVWFKGHPRDNDILIKLQKALIRITGNNDYDYSWLNVFDHVIPYELYLCTGYFNDDISTNKKVKLFTAYSTIQLFLHADGLVSQVEKTFVSDWQKINIESIYGKNSKIFPYDKLVLQK